MSCLAGLAVLAIVQSGPAKPSNQKPAVLPQKVVPAKPEEAPKGQPTKQEPSKANQPKAVSAESVIDAAMYNRMSGQSDVWFKDGDYPKIIQLLRFQAESFPTDYETWSNLGWMLENVEDENGASAVYSEYARRNPSDPDATLPEAQRLFLNRDYKAAVAIAAKALNDRAHPNLWRIAANSYERLGQFEKSAAIWKRYLKLHPKDEPAQNRLNTVLKKLAEQKTGKSG